MIPPGEQHHRGPDGRRDIDDELRREETSEETSEETAS